MEERAQTFTNLKRAKSTREVWVMRGDASGTSWDAPRNITSTAKAASWSWYATGPGAGIQLQSGRLVAPCDHAVQRYRRALPARRLLANC